MNKRQKKKQLKKLVVRMRSCRKNGKALMISCQTPIYDNVNIVGVRLHNPIIKEFDFKENDSNE